MKDDYDDDEAKKFGEEIGFGGADNFRDIFNNVDVEIGEGSETSDDLLNDLLQEIGQDFGGLGRISYLIQLHCNFYVGFFDFHVYTTDLRIPHGSFKPFFGQQPRYPQKLSMGNKSVMFQDPKNVHGTPMD